MNKYKKIITILAVLAVFTSISSAEMIDLTNPTVLDKDDLNGAWFYWVDASSTGSGVIDPFVRINTNNEVEQGYNSDYRSNKDPKFPEFDENSSPTFTHSLLLSSVPVVDLEDDGTNILYREFLLDINQKNSEGDSLLSLDRVEIYLYSDGNRHDYVGGWGDPIYSLDTDTQNNFVKLDYGLNHGSGSGDMLMYIPNDLFVGGDYVYLYSMFGENYINNSGFEEWAVRLGDTPPPPPVPIPGAVLLGFIGIFASGIKLRKFA
jgi:hypothetical protein